MSNDLTIVVKRIIREMDKLQSSQAPEVLPMYMGLGLALAFAYQAETGRSIVRDKIKPQQLVQWAKGLPTPLHSNIIIPGE